MEVWVGDKHIHHFWIGVALIIIGVIILIHDLHYEITHYGKVYGVQKLLTLK